MDDQTLLAELSDEAEANLNRHLDASKTWYPHQLIPWSKGTDYTPDYKWTPDQTNIPEPVRVALYVNLLTEDNLPYYFRDIHRLYGHADGAWGEWTRRWTAEEGRHAIAIRDYLHVTKAIDPIWLEDGRMAQISSGKTPTPQTAPHGLAYVAMQELATRISHRNTGKLLGQTDKTGYDIMARIATDENHHFIFYRDMAKAALNADPTTMMQAIRDEVIGFTMPGLGIPGFQKHAKTIAKAGIYDLQLHHDQILIPVVLQHWNIENIEGLDDPGKQAQEQIVAHIHKTGRVANRIKERQQTTS